MRSIADIDRLGTVDAAAGMRIASVEPVLLSHRYPPEHVQTWSGGSLPGTTAGLVRITTADGLYGIGETYAAVFAPEVVRELVKVFEPFLVGADPSRIQDLWLRCCARTFYWGRYGISRAVLAAIEAALWDLMGKATGKPVHALLGTGHGKLPRYASGGMDATGPALAAEQAGYAAKGFLASKIRAGMDPSRDFEKAAAAREALGPDVRLAVDAVQGSNPNPWTSDQAIITAKRLEELDLLWLEEPCGAADHEGYAAVRRATSIPVAGGETATTLEEFRRFIDADALDLAQPDAAHTGGILETLRCCAVAEARGVPVAVHAWASGGSVMSNYHAAFAAPNTQWLEYPTQPNPLITELMTQPLEIVDGYVRPPSAPGLGIDVTPELEAKYPYQPGCHYLFYERR